MELYLFAVPPTQTSIEEGSWIEHQPLTYLDSGGPIEFILPGTGDADLANTYLLVGAKIVNGNGTDIVAVTPVAPVNNWLHSLFSQVDVYLNDTLVTPSSNTYPFRSYVETLLSYGAEAKKTQLTSQLWYKDTAGHTEGTTVNAGSLGLDYVNVPSNVGCVLLCIFQKFGHRFTIQRIHLLWLVAIRATMEITAMKLIRRSCFRTPPIDE